MKHIAVKAIIAFLIAAGCVQPSRGDSLWPAGRTTSSCADKRARAVGDLLTVIIVQSSIVSHEADSQTDKSTSASADKGTGLLKLFPDLGLSAERSTSGSGSTSGRTQLADRMTVRVTEVLPNGVLKIEGARTTNINADKLEARLTGVVRSQDISAEDTVLSTAIADQQIVWTGKGPIAEKQKPGIISWLLHFLF